jgi:hypothetical protein
MNLNARKKASMHSNSMMILNSYSALEYYPKCIQSQFKSIIIQVNNELMNACMMQCMEWMMKQVHRK